MHKAVLCLFGYGAIFCQGSFLNKGNGHDPGLCCNHKVIMNLNRQYVISVNIVPNTWEEYALPESTETTVAGP